MDVTPIKASTIDSEGKSFFREVRNRLSYDQFNLLLKNIKQLNSGLQSREEAIEKSRLIFGTENKDLFWKLTKLLNRT